MSTTSSESGGISKLIIKSYADNTFASEMEHFEASINPEDIHIVRDINYNIAQPPGMPGMLFYDASAPRLLTFKLLFDDTGIIPDAPEGGVEGQLSYLSKVISDLQGDSNSPSYIRVIWGVIDFKGRLAHLETTYTRFRPEGTPIRAKVSVSVLEEVDTTATHQSSDSQTNNQPSKASSKRQASATGDSAAGAVVSSPAANEPGAVASEGQVAADSNDQVDSEGGAGTTNEEDNASDQADGEEDPGTTNEEDNASDQADGEEDPGTTNEEDNASDQADGEEDSGIAGDKVHEVKEGDSVAIISKDALGDSKLAPGIAALNGLNSLRGGLPLGLALALPLGKDDMLAKLLKKAGNYAKKEAVKLKEKAVAAKDKAKEKTGAAKKTVKEKI